MKELVLCSQNVWHKKSGPWEMSNWHGSPPKREVEEGLFAREFFSLPLKKEKKRNRAASEMFAGKLRTLILMLSKKEVMLAGALLSFSS